MIYKFIIIKLYYILKPLFLLNYMYLYIAQRSVTGVLTKSATILVTEMLIKVLLYHMFSLNF